MSYQYSMAYLTSNGLSPLEAIKVAARCGYDAISFRFLPAGPDDCPPPLLTDDALVRDIKLALDDTGLFFSDAEMIRLNEDTDLSRFRPFLDRISDMGARHILVAGDDPESARLTECYGRLCELVGTYRLTADLEFMPWTAVPDLTAARRMVEQANSPAAAILVDTLHFDRSNGDLQELADLPGKFVNYVQICDGPIPYGTDTSELIRIARTQRLCPGDGDIDLLAIANVLPQSGLISVEVPNLETAREIGPDALALRALEKTKTLMSQRK